MFGYVLLNQAALTEEARTRYQTAYCGLCHRLGDLHGLRGRLTLSYDLTFLSLLLGSLYEDDAPAAAGLRRCPTHPFKAQPWRAGCAADYCADLSIALHYYAAQDKWDDDRSPAGLALMAALKGRLPGIEQRWPAQCTAIQTELAALRRLEQENCQQPDTAAACFGRLMAALFDYRQDHWSGELRTIGDTLGRYIYLLDAADDLEKDQKKGRYNPLMQYSQTADWRAALYDGLLALMAQCTAAFEVLPCVTDADLLRNILYSGVWSQWPGENAAKNDEQTPPQD